MADDLNDLARALMSAIRPDLPCEDDLTADGWITPTATAKALGEPHNRVANRMARACESGALERIECRSRATGKAIYAYRLAKRD